MERKRGREFRPFRIDSLKDSLALLTSERLIRLSEAVFISEGNKFDIFENQSIKSLFSNRIKMIIIFFLKSYF